MFNCALTSVGGHIDHQKDFTMKLLQGDIRLLIYEGRLISVYGPFPVTFRHLHLGGDPHPEAGTHQPPQSVHDDTSPYIYYLYIIIYLLYMLTAVRNPRC